MLSVTHISSIFLFLHVTKCTKRISKKKKKKFSISEQIFSVNFQCIIILGNANKLMSSNCACPINFNIGMTGQVTEKDRDSEKRTLAEICMQMLSGYYMSPLINSILNTHTQYINLSFALLPSSRWILWHHRGTLIARQMN